MGGRAGGVERHFSGLAKGIVEVPHFCVIAANAPVFEPTTKIITTEFNTQSGGMCRCCAKNGDHRRFHTATPVAVLLVQEHAIQK